MTQRNEPPLLSVQQVLADGIYAIPAYQRNYAWGVAEISQLIEDVWDYARRNAQRQTHDYYIGTLVVYERQTEKQHHWEVVDGQQRLTTLSLLVSVLRGMHHELQSLMPRMPLRFECREASSHALQAVFARPLKTFGQDATAIGDAVTVAAEDVSGASSIWAGRSIIEDSLRQMPAAERRIFAGFLLNQVKLLRVQLPARTDLNHYFECMNNRGEQLAAHEVLKARLLAILQQGGHPVAMQMLHTVWDACAVMERSVQSGFAPALRKQLFSADGRSLAVEDLAALLNCFRAQDRQPTAYKSLTQLLVHEPWAVSGKPRKAEAAEDEEEDEGLAQFRPVINFPNFLLQVLAMMPGAAFAETVLDDKQLLTAFEPLLLGDAEHVQDFAFRLLRCRFLLDQHVIKSSLDSQDDEEHWQLQRCRFRNEKASLQWVKAFDDGESDLSERLRMLQAALHVSFMLPTRKHWLQGALRWLSRQKIHEAIDAGTFLLALEAMAKAFVLEVGVDTERPMSYEEVVRREEGFFVLQDKDSEMMRALPLKLVYGRVRLIDFNFLDYLLWLAARIQNKAHTQEWQDFSFTSSRRSIEHLHPQTELFRGNAWDDDHLHAFGNLCLVSHAMNSRLGNSGPEDKFKQLMSERKSLSLKILDMNRCFEANQSWLHAESMSCHGERILSLLRNAFEQDDLMGISDFSSA